MSTQSDLAEAAKCFCFNDATARAVVVYILLSKTGLLAMTPSELAIAAKNYSYDLDTWKKTVAYLLAVEAGLQGQTPSQLADASKCFCFNDGTWKKVVAYLLNAGGTGSCPQDMQVAWTPTNIKIGEMLSFATDPNFGGGSVLPGVTALNFQGSVLPGFIDIESCVDLLSVSFPNLTTLTGSGGGNYIAVQGNPVLTSVDLPLLTASGQNLPVINGNPNLTTINVPVFLPTPTRSINWRNNALDAASVNMILARCVAVPTWGNVGENLFLDGGTSAAPSGQGVADKATLIGRGATVTTN